MIQSQGHIFIYIIGSLQKTKSLYNNLKVLTYYYIRKLQITDKY